MTNQDMIHQLSVIEGYCEHVYAEKVLLEQQITNGAGGSTTQQNLEIQRLKSEVVTYTGIIAAQKSTIDTLAVKSPEALKQALADNNALNNAVLQKDAAYKNLLDNYYDPLVNDAKGYLLQIKTLEAEVTALQAGAPPLPAGVQAPPAGVNLIPAAYAPVQPPNPQLNPAVVPQQAAPVNQEGGGGVLGMIGRRWRGYGAASNTPVAPDTAGAAGGALVINAYYTDAEIDAMKAEDMRQLSMKIGLGGARIATDVRKAALKNYYHNDYLGGPGGVGQSPSLVQAGPPALGGNSGGAAAGGAVRNRVAALNNPPFVDPIILNPTEMKADFKLQPWNMKFEATMGKTAILDSILNSTAFQDNIDPLAIKYKIPTNITQKSGKIELLLQLWQMTAYINSLTKTAFTDFVSTYKLGLAANHKRFDTTVAALNSKTWAEILAIRKNPALEAALLAMD
jgi:hypothetical protein